MDDFLQSLIQSSFSIVVAGFLLLRVEKEMKKLAAVIDRLRHCQVCRFSPPWLNSGPSGFEPDLKELGAVDLIDVDVVKQEILSKFKTSE